MRKRIGQAVPEFCFAPDTFNLFRPLSVAVDPVKVHMDRSRADAAAEQAEIFQMKFLQMLTQCPGFIGADAPRQASLPAKVVLEPGRIVDAMAWLKRRFHVNEELELDPNADGICVEVLVRKVGGRKGGVRRKPFAKVEQYELKFA